MLGRLWPQIARVGPRPLNRQRGAANRHTRGTWRPGWHYFPMINRLRGINKSPRVLPAITVKGKGWAVRGTWACFSASNPIHRRFGSAAAPKASSRQRPKSAGGEEPIVESYAKKLGPAAGEMESPLCEKVNIFSGLGGHVRQSASVTWAPACERCRPVLPPPTTIASCSDFWVDFANA